MSGDSPLAGRELVRRKVAALFVMGPYFNERGEFQRAYNFTTAPKACCSTLLSTAPTAARGALSTGA